MLIFITHPKYFNIKVLKDKKPKLIYIFNSKILFNTLKENFKCVNIGNDGKIINENYFPKMIVSKQTTRQFFQLRIQIYAYFKKKSFNHQRKLYQMRGSYKNNMYRIVVNTATKEYKTDVNQGFEILNDGIFSEINEIIKIEFSQKEHRQKDKYFKMIFNFANSFFRSYIYALGFRRRGVEIFGDVFQYNFALNSIINYKFNEYDIYQNKFDYRYLKVLSRIFIETIHRNDVKYFISQNINYYKENEWW